VPSLGGRRARARAACVTGSPGRDRRHGHRLDLAVGAGLISVDLQEHAADAQGRALVIGDDDLDLIHVAITADGPGTAEHVWPVPRRARIGSTNPGCGTAHRQANFVLNRQEAPFCGGAKGRSVPEETLVAWLVPGLLLGVLGIPRPPWWRWATAAVLLAVLVGVALIGSYLTRNILFATFPLLALLIATVMGALCVLSARLLQDPMWWPSFSDEDGAEESDEGGRRGRLTVALCAALFADLVLSAWVRDPAAHQPAVRANVAASFQILLLAPIAFLQSSYLNALMRREKRRLKTGYMTKQELDFGKVAWSRLIGLGIPTGLLVLSMVSEVIAKNGLDDSARPKAWATWPLLVAFAGAWAVLLATRFYVKTVQQDRDTLDLPLRLVIPIIVAMTGVCAIAYFIDHTFFQVGWAAVLSLIYGTAVAESIYFHTAGEHLARPRAAVISAMAAVSIFATLLVLWLLSCALWSDGRPLYAPSAVLIAMLTLAGSGLLIWTVGSILAAKRVRNLSGYTTEQNLGIDLLTYAGLGLMLAVLPDLLVGHLKYEPRDERLWALLFAAIVLGLQSVQFVKQTFRAVDVLLDRKKSMTFADRIFGIIDQLLGQQKTTKKSGQQQQQQQEITILLMEGEPLVNRADSLLHDQRVRRHFRLLRRTAWLAVAVSLAWILSTVV